MADWQGKSKATALGYRIFVKTLTTFGIRPAYLLLKLVAGYYCLFSKTSTRASWQFFRQGLGLGWWPGIGKLYRNYEVFGQTLIDKVVVMGGLKNPFSFDFEGEDILREMVAGGRGGLLLSAHMGNWEIAGHLLQRLKTRVNVVMFDGEHEAIKAYLEKVAGKRIMQVIIIKDDLSHIYAINEALNRNELVCMHADRFLPGNKTLSQNFLGRPASFPAGPFVLAATFKVPVSFVFAFKESWKHYHFYASNPVDHGVLPKKDLQQKLLADFSAQMEEKIKKYPEQWFNYYDFWG